MMGKGHKHEELVEGIYDAADDPRGFAPVLERIAEMLRASAGQTFVIPTTGLPPESHHFGSDEGSFETYERVWKHQDPRFAIAMAKPGDLHSDVAVIDAKVFERSALYNEALAPYDVRYTLFGNFAVSPDLLLATAFMRPKRYDAFDEAEKARLRALVPHLSRAARLRRVVGALRAELDDLRRALDVVPLPIAVLDASGKVICANASAHERFGARDGLRTERSTLTACVPSEQRELAAAIANAAALADVDTRKSATSGSATTVTVSSAFGSIGVVLFPLRATNAVRERGAASARVLALIHDPSKIVRVDRRLTAELHGLTPTEAELAASLAEGRTLADFAAARGSSEATARTHLKRILDKTQTKRQADLVRLLLTGVAMHHLR